MKNLILISAIIFSFNTSYGQEDTEYPDSFKELYSIIFDGDTIATADIEAVSVVHYKFNSARDRSIFYTTKRRVEKVKPYYEIAIKVLDDLNKKEEESNKRQYKKYKRTTKKELVNKFEKELRDLTMSEGKILVKMINRNTGYSFNDLIKEYTNPVKVWVYNIAAKKYGYDLKEVYDAQHPENHFLEKALKASNY